MGVLKLKFFYQNSIAYSISITTECIKAQRKIKLPIFSVIYSVLHVQYLPSVGSFFIPGAMWVHQDVNPLDFFPEELFRHHVFRTDIDSLNFAYFPSLWDCRLQILPFFPLLQFSGDSSTHVKASLLWPN